MASEALRRGAGDKRGIAPVDQRRLTKAHIITTQEGPVDREMLMWITTHTKRSRALGRTLAVCWKSKQSTSSKSYQRSKIQVLATSVAIVDQCCYVRQ